MDYKKILNGVLSKAYKFDDGKIAELFKDGENEEISEADVISKILNVDVDRVEKIKQSVDGKEKFQQGYAKAKSEVLETFESDLKSKFNLETSHTGIDLVNEIVEKTSKPNSEITEDAIRRSKIYLDLENRAKNEIKELKTQHQQEVDNIKSVYEGEKIFSSVNKNAIQILNELNPVLPTNKAVAENQISAFMNQFKDFNFDIQDDRIVVLDKDKKVVVDQHGNTKLFEDIVKEKASTFFEFTANNGGSGSGNGGNGTPNPAGGANVQVPKTMDDFINIMNDNSIDGTEKLKIAEAFEKAQQPDQ